MNISNIIFVQHTENSTATPPNGSWLNYWSEQTGIEIPFQMVCPCCLKQCFKIQMVGAHVSDSEGNVYIIPTCKECNDKYKNSKAENKIFFVDKGKLAPLNS